MDVVTVMLPTGLWTAVLKVSNLTFAIVHLVVAIVHFWRQNLSYLDKNVHTSSICASMACCNVKFCTESISLMLGWLKSTPTEQMSVIDVKAPLLIMSICF